MSFRSYLDHLNHRSTRLFPSFRTIIFLGVLSLTFLSIFSIIHRSYAANNETADQLIKRINVGKSSGSAVEWYSDYLQKVHSVINLQIAMGNDVLSYNQPGWTPGGVIGSTNQIIGQLYAPPASGIEYIAHLKDNLLGRPAYAQGAGFTGLQPIMSIWTEFRNIAYLLSSLFFIIIGLMIILRVKVSPQATITIQSAIPQLVTTLILITFSYAIAGLMIDLTYLLQGMAAVSLFPSSTTGLGGDFLNFISLIPGVGKLIPSLANMVEPNFQSVLGTLALPALSTAMLGLIAGFTINAIMGPLAIMQGGGVLSAGVSAIAAIIILIIVGIGIIFWLFKFLIGLLKCYAMVIFKIVIAPLEIGIGAFPNSKIGFSSWFLDLVSNLFVFPISFIFLLIANKILMSIIGAQTLLGIGEILKLVTGGMATNNIPSLWVPSLLGGSNGTSGTVIAAGAIGLSTLMLLSKLPDMIPQYIFMLKPSPWGTAIGEGLTKSTAAQMAGITAKGYTARGVGAGMQAVGTSMSASTNSLIRDAGTAIAGAGTAINTSGPGSDTQIQDALSKRALN